MDNAWLSVDDGVSGQRCNVHPGNHAVIDSAPDELLWITVLEGRVDCKFTFPAGGKLLNRGDSTLVAWPKGEWQTFIDAPQSGVAAVIRITLNALHRFLSVDFTADRGTAGNMDYSVLTRTVHLSPILIRNLEKLFLQEQQSMFKSMAQKGAFLAVFAEMLGILFGQEIEQCPYHIDTGTENKIRHAQQLLVENLDRSPDLQQLAVEVDLPKNVLKEGFRFLFGKPVAEYINDYKFEKARTMLESGRFLIKEVAFALGYQNPSHFISTFKRRYGITPKQWSKQQLKSARGSNA